MADVSEPTVSTEQPEASAPPGESMTPEPVAVSSSPTPEPAPAEPSPQHQRPEDDASEPSSTFDDVDLPPTPIALIAPSLLPLERVDIDPTFCLREEAELADVDALATDIGRLGQLFPIDVRVVDADRFQIVTGFRRVAALRMLQRDRVLARLHTELSDDDALTMALASAIHGKNVSPESLGAAQQRLEAEGRLLPAGRDMLEKALATDSALGPEAVEEEVDADELASDVTQRLGECNQDLSLLADVFDDLDQERRDELLKQLRYSIELVSFLESKA